MTEAYIYDACRTPRGKGRPDGSLHEVTSLALSARLLNAVKDRNGLEGHAVEDVDLGQCHPGQGTGWLSGAVCRWRPIWTNAFPACRSTASAPRGWRP